MKGRVNDGGARVQIDLVYLGNKAMKEEPCPTPTESS